MVKSVDPESLRQRLLPLVENILNEAPSEQLQRRLVEFGLECYHAGRRAERQFWGQRLASLAEECAAPVFDEIKIEPD
jgi:hypothetical protein